MAEASHHLLLPLPAAYAHNEREGYSLFASTATAHPTSEEDAEYAALDRYANDLCAFLQKARLVQSHPDHYFEFVRGEAWQSTAVHFDGSPVMPEEVDYTLRLCGAFAPFIHGDSLSELRQLVKDGPPPFPAAPVGSSDSTSSHREGREEEEEAVGPSSDAARHAYTELVDFFSATKRLMLRRTRRENNDAARLTLLVSKAEQKQLCLPDTAAMQRAQRIEKLVLSYGMNAKKRHEVPIMREAIADLVRCCNVRAASERTTAHPGGNACCPSEEGKEEEVRTVINVGEGKGYVSRALALCNGLQVVGLDCNPAHKERAVERFEHLLEGSLSCPDGECGKDMVNLLYVPRGHVASIACRVGERVDWADLLCGHVHLAPDGTSLHDAALIAENAAPLASDDEVDNAGEDEGKAARTHNATSAPTPVGGVAVEKRQLSSSPVLSHRAKNAHHTLSKLQCRLCGMVVRQTNTTVVLKHVFSHISVANGDDTDPHKHRQHRLTAAEQEARWTELGLPSREDVVAWNVQLSQHVYAERLTQTFYQPFVEPSCATDNTSGERNDDASSTVDGNEAGRTPTSPRGSVALPLEQHGQKRLREVGCTSSPTPHTSTAVLSCPLPLRRLQLTRGYRAAVYAPRLDPPPTGPQAADPAAGVTAGEVPSLRCWSYVETVLTVVGFDQASGRHRVLFDNETKRESLELLGVVRDDTAGTAGGPSLSNTHPSEVQAVLAQLPPAEEWGPAKAALVLSLVPMAEASTPVVRVPSLRNTVMIGLHTCGDLGSNVCRLYGQSSARGLLLVSCCWHALTPAGFPLSEALRRRGMTTDKISLLLATQPLDMWSTASPEGHKSSAKLLFYRSLVKLLFGQLSGEWPMSPECAQCATVCEKRAGSGGVCCTFGTAPHLEPAFLRRVSRVKDTITFEGFALKVCHEYLFAGQAKTTAYTWQNDVCAGCRLRQEAFMRRRLCDDGLAKVVGDRYYTAHFGKFLGMTVLRMWMCHLVEGLLLMDRVLFLHETLSREAGSRSVVSLVPLFDGAISPRLYGIMARRYNTTQ